VNRIVAFDGLALKKVGFGDDVADKLSCDKSLQKLFSKSPTKLPHIPYFHSNKLAEWATIMPFT
jgi:hypothetical protein